MNWLMSEPSMVGRTSRGFYNYSLHPGFWIGKWTPITFLPSPVHITGFCPIVNWRTVPRATIWGQHSMTHMICHKTAPWKTQKIMSCWLLPCAWSIFTSVRRNYASESNMFLLGKWWKWEIPQQVHPSWKLQHDWKIMSLQWEFFSVGRPGQKNDQHLRKHHHPLSFC